MASSHRICSATVDGGREITTSVLTQADWVDIAIPLATDHDRFAPAMAHPAALTGALTDDMASRAAQRLAEIRLLGIRLVDMPLFRLLSVDLGNNAISGTLGLTQFADYALTADLLDLNYLTRLHGTAWPICRSGMCTCRIWRRFWICRVGCVLVVSLLCVRSRGRRAGCGVRPTMCCWCRSGPGAC